MNDEDEDQGDEEVILCTQCGLPVDGDRKAVKVCEFGGCHHKNAVKCTKGDCVCSVCFGCHELHPCEMHRPFFRDQLMRDFATDKFEEMGYYWVRPRDSLVQDVQVGFYAPARPNAPAVLITAGDGTRWRPEEWEPLAFIPEWEVDDDG